MQFNSYTFILYLFPICFALYYLLNKFNNKLGKLILIAFGILFYVYGAKQHCLVLFISIILNYLLYFILQNKNVRISRKIIFITGISINISLLVVFKYTNFIIQTFNSITNSSIATFELTMPLAISFFTFQQIAFLVSVYNGSLEYVSTIDYLLYVLYFPKLISGPIVEPMDIIPQFNDSQKKRVSITNLASGLRIFGYGLFKKVLLADTFAKAVSWGFSNCEIASSADLIIVMVSYTFEIYFDFSGYCDMGIGISQMLNIDLPSNFNSPYKSISIRDFWKRWHISLTKFLTKYIYIPLGGSKKGIILTCINTMVVFAISGIWHGANYTFILWGLLHGMLNLVDRFTNKLQSKIIEPVRWFINFVIINILWLLFASPSVTQWLSILKTIITCQNTSISSSLIENFVSCEHEFIYDILHISPLNESIRGLSMIIFIITSFIICLVPENNSNNRKKYSYAGAIVSAFAFIWGFISLSGESTFVYFNF